VASYVLTNDKSYIYNDIDFIFRCDLSTEQKWSQIKSLVFQCISINYFPQGTTLISPVILQQAYVEKMIRVVNQENDCWGLISLCNHYGQNFELKFLDRMKRQFQFSVDSFQIILDPLLDYYEKEQKYEKLPITKTYSKTNGHYDNQQCLNGRQQKLYGGKQRYSTPYPYVYVECVYGNFNLALYHLNKKLIATNSPEGIRGGGLLKYCLLLIRGYRPADIGTICQMEKYMCSRFFIDYADIQEQEHKLTSYLYSHFNDDDQIVYKYLLQLRLIVHRSTVCLMTHERKLTLDLITNIATYYYYKLYTEGQWAYEHAGPNLVVPNSVSIDVIYHDDYPQECTCPSSSKWKSIYTPQQTVKFYDD
ncbi:unnamed protein product, partial [Didymodactylos carnosus]